MLRITLKILNIFLVISCFLQMIELLIAYGANVNDQTKTGWTPLHRACEMGFVQAAKVKMDSKINHSCIT